MNLLAPFLMCGAAAFSGSTTLNLSGPCPSSGGNFFYVPFEVPAGVAEVEVYHMNTGDPDNILDFGLNDSVGFRGWGGGNRENAVVGLNATSRSYLAGPMPAGTWSVVVGKAQLSLPPCAFDIQVTLRDAPTLPPQPERQPYAPHSPLSDAARYYSGDFHIHGRESGDAYTSATLDEIASFAHGARTRLRAHLRPQHRQCRVVYG